MNPFEELLKDIISITKNDGTEIKNIKARVSQENITIYNAKLKLEVGNIISRKIPNGIIEKYEITDIHFSSGTKSKKGKIMLPDKFIMKYKKL